MPLRPRDGWLFYDEWFSKFSRAADGDIILYGKLRWKGSITDEGRNHCKNENQKGDMILGKIDALEMKPTLEFLLPSPL